MTKNFQFIKGQMGSRFKSPGKSPKRPNPGRRRSAGGGSGQVATGGGGTAANIRVAVRVRPENEREKAGAFRNVINVVDEQMLIFDPQDAEESFYVHGRKQGMRDLNKKQHKDKKFTFDSVFNCDSTNPEVFNGTTKDLVDIVFQGYNCSVFAYGATGAGKTFTMLGSQEHPGITCLTMGEIYRKIETLSEDISCEIGVSYLEVYNETVRDLLRPDGILNMREDGKAGIAIPGLSIHKPTCPDDILRLLSFGNKNRSQHPTDANKESSRSHAVLQVFVQQKDKDAGLSAEVKVAKLSMIDLAGSEKGCVTGNKGIRFREGSNINKSLLALGNCINALAAGSKYIPYRDSKLTRLLKDSIGGNCRTVMIANVSPSSETFEDTFNTLKYADRAKKIKIDLKKNVLNVDFHVAQYAKIVEDLRGEIGALKEKIRSLEVENEALKASSSSQTRDGVEAMELDHGGEANIEILQMKAQLADLLERQRDYDALQERMAESERQNLLQSQQIAVLQSCAAAATTSQQTAEIRELKEQLRRQAEYIAQLENSEKLSDSAATGQTTAAVSERASGISEELSQLLNKRRQLVKQFGTESTLLSTLMLRAHFKQQQQERAELISMTKLEKEKSVLNAARALEALHRKVEKKGERRDWLRRELETNRASLDRILANNPDSDEVRMAELELRLTESQTEANHLHEMVNILGCELERLSEDMSVALPLLSWNEKLLRGHSILSNEDKERFDNLQQQILSNKQITWAENINNSISGELVAAGNVYKLCARIELPSLLPHKRPASREQRVLFEDSTLQAVVGNDTLLTDTQESTVLETDTSCSLRQLEEAAPAPATADTSSEDIPATPQITRQNSGSMRPNSSNLTNDTSFVISPSPGTTSGAENKENQLPEVNTTPKRPAEQSDEETSSAKKLRLDASYKCTPSVWLAHRSANVVGTPGLDQSLGSDAGGCSPDLGVPAGGLNETVTLISRLGSQCDLGPDARRSEMPAPCQRVAAPSVVCLNATYALDDDDDMRMEGVEPMVVEDITHPVLESSLIWPPVKEVSLVAPTSSPVKAGMGLSPVGMPGTRRTPSPLRQSTLIGMKSATIKSGAAAMPPPTKPWRGRTPLKSASSTTPQPTVKAAARRNLTSSQSTSVLPKPGPQPPVSFRSTIQRLNDPEPAQSSEYPALPEQREATGGYMQATAASKLKQGGTLERKKPNLQETSTGVRAKAPATGVTVVSQKFGKFKRSVSASVLRQNK